LLGRREGWFLENIHHSAALSPWLGFFEMIAASDAYVAFDHVKFEPSSWQQRNRIKGPTARFHYCPCAEDARGFDRICDKEIEYGEPWVKST
jgi:hypothetical protein